MMENVTIRDARITFKNFRGLGSDYNREGDRNFAIVLDKKLAEKLRALGWNVKSKEPKPEYRDEGDDELFHYLSVKVSFKFRPPAVWFIEHEGTKKTRLPEDLVDLVDGAQFEKIDLTIRPRKWDHGGRSGISAYLQTFYGTLREDPLDIEYRDIEEYSHNPPAIESGREMKALPAGSSEDDNADYVEYEYDGSRVG
jgi:hypothetical protein